MPRRDASSISGDDKQARDNNRSDQQQSLSNHDSYTKQSYAPMPNKQQKHDGNHPVQKLDLSAATAIPPSTIMGDFVLDFEGDQEMLDYFSALCTTPKSATTSSSSFSSSPQAVSPILSSSLPRSERDLPSTSGSSSPPSASSSRVPSLDFSRPPGHAYSPWGEQSDSDYTPIALVPSFAKRQSTSSATLPTWPHASSSSASPPRPNSLHERDYAHHSSLPSKVSVDSGNRPGNRPQTAFAAFPRMSMDRRAGMIRTNGQMSSASKARGQSPSSPHIARQQTNFRDLHLTDDEYSTDEED